MKRMTAPALAVVVIAAEVASIGITATSAYAQDSISRKVRQQRQLLLQQQRQLDRNRRELDAQRRQLGRAGPERRPYPAVDHGLFGDCPLGFTYYLIGGCKPDHAVIIYNGGALGGHLPAH